MTDKPNSQFPTWLRFAVAALVAVVLSLLATGGLQAAVICVMAGGIVGLFVAGCFLRRFYLYSWLIVIGALLGSAGNLLVALSLGDIHRENLVYTEHWKFDHPDVTVADRLAMNGSFVGTGLGLVAAWLASLWRPQQRIHEAGGPDIRPRIAGIFILMGVPILLLGLHLFHKEDPRGSPVLNLGAILVVLSLLDRVYAMLRRPVQE